jgi:hypothetical protein
MAVENFGYGNPLPIEGTTSFEGPDDFELTATDALREGIKAHGFGRTRREFTELIDKIMADPFGETNIDAFKDTDAGQWVRLVHEVTGPLSDLIPGKKIAIKGTGLDMQRGMHLGPSRDKLSDQFRNTLRAQRAQSKLAPEGVEGSLFINEVFGIVSYRNKDGKLQEWMLMEYIEEGVPLEQYRLAMTSGGVQLGFLPDQYPELAGIAAGRRGHETYRSTSMSPILFKDLGKRLMGELGLYQHELDDLNGNNVLLQQTEQGPRYTVIDLQSHSH